MHWPAAAEVLSHHLDGPDRRRASDALHGMVDQLIQALQTEGQVRAAFAAGQGMDLVDDHAVHVGQGVPHR